MQQPVQPGLRADAKAIVEYLEAAPTAPGQERSDRIVEAFRTLRAALTEADWHKLPGMRDLLSQYGMHSPYIPLAVREREMASRAIRQDSSAFIAAWQAIGGDVVDHDIDPADFVSTAEADVEASRRLQRRFPQGGRPLLLKVAEYQLALGVARELRARRIVELAGETSFPPIATQVLWDASVLHVAEGSGTGAPRRVAPRIEQHSAPPGRIPAADGSVDLVMLGDIFPRLAGDGDRAMLAEVSRVLRPGGRALVLPLVVAGKHSLTINPSAAFLVRRSVPLASMIEAEMQESGARIDFNHAITTPFTRRYDAATLQARLSGAGLGLQVLRPRFPTGFGGELWDEQLLGQDVPRDLFVASRMVVLSLTKPS